MMIVEINGELYEFPITKIEINTAPASYFEPLETLNKYNPFGE
ncbi:hypothetical protein KGEDBEEJ_02256 [Aeromonas hydrophila]